jgi:LPXTG-motif cell wall-anchored protein
MKNVLIIAGSLALIGGGIYFYSKKKKEEQKVNKLQALTEPTPIPTTPTTTVNSELSPLSVAYGDDQIKLQKAKEYVKKYVSLSKLGAVGEKNAFKVLNAKLKKIGYTYKDGLLTKI